ncbi:unnamed protein product, partial [marine sediment metagenome]
ELNNATCNGRTAIREAAAIEDTHPERYADYIEFSGTAEVYCGTALENPWFALVGDTVAIELLSQKPIGALAVFDGACIIDAVSDVQRQGDWEMQTISWVSAEAPTTPA